MNKEDSILKSDIDLLQNQSKLSLSQSDLFDQDIKSREELFQQEIQVEYKMILRKQDSNQEIKQIQQKDQKKEVTEEEKENKVSQNKNYQDYLNHSNFVSEFKIDSQSLNPEDINQKQDIYANLQNSIFQKSTFRKAFFERKQQSYDELNKWDSQRSEYSLKHQEITRQILQELDQKINLSMYQMEKIVYFFHQKKDVELQYSKAVAQNLIWKNEKAKKNKSEDLQLKFYPHLKDAFQQFDLLFESHSQKIGNLVVFIDKNILNDVLLIEVKQYDADVRQLKKKIRGYKELIETQQHFLQKRFQKYNIIYELIVMGVQKKKKDLYNWEQKYKEAAYKLVKTQQMYGQLALSIWDEIKRLETNRVEVIKKCFNLFMAKYYDIYGKSDSLERIEKIFNGLQSINESEQNFDIKVSTNKQKNMNLKEIQQYFQQFSVPLEPKGYHKLIQRIFEVERDNGIIGFKWIKCEMIFTVDEFVLVYDGEKRQAFKKPYRKFYIDYVILKNYEDQKKNKCYMLEERPGFLFNSSSKILLQFGDEDELGMFQLYFKQFLSERQQQQEIKDQEKELAKQEKEKQEQERKERIKQEKEKLKQEKEKEKFERQNSKIQQIQIEDLQKN